MSAAAENCIATEEMKVLDLRENFDQVTSWYHRFMRKKAVRVLWSVFVLLLVGFQILTFVRRRHEFFHSTYELVLVVAFIVVMTLGIFVKSRQDGWK